MRHLFETAARALRARREMAVAITTAAVAAILIIGGQGNLAAIIAAGAAGLMGGHAKRYRLEANELFRELIKTKVQAADSATAEAERHRLEVGSWRRRLAALVKETREHLSYLERNATSYEWYALHLRWEIKRAEERLARNGLLSEQTQLVDILPPEEADKFYSDTEEVNTTDTAAEE
ncbi:MAG: hypothetical protein ACFNYO_02125 [Candidatus Saccharimonas sp.]